MATYETKPMVAADQHIRVHKFSRKIGGRVVRVLVPSAMPRDHWYTQQEASKKFAELEAEHGRIQ